MQIRLVAIEAGKVLLPKKFIHRQLITFTANLQTSLIGMEACSGTSLTPRSPLSKRLEFLSHSLGEIK
jgi:hypothetical protein